MDLQLLAAEKEGEVEVLQMDVTDRESIATAAQSVHRKVSGIDVLINNAGISPRGERYFNLDAGTMLEMYHVNTIGPMIVSQVFLDLLRTGRNPRIINISSRMGSLEAKDEGGHYTYSSSKAALNMLTRALSYDLRSEGIVVAALHPGWVQTDMGGEHATLTPQESVRGMLEVINRLTEEDSGKFYTWEGHEHPW